MKEIVKCACKQTHSAGKFVRRGAPHCRATTGINLRAGGHYTERGGWDGGGGGTEQAPSGCVCMVCMQGHGLVGDPSISRVIVQHV